MLQAAGRGGGVLQGSWLWEEAGAALCGTQTALTDPRQSTAKPLSQAGGTSGKTRSRKGTQSQRKEEEEQPHGRADIPCSSWKSPHQRWCSLQPLKDPTVERKDIPEGTAAHEEPTPEQREDMRRKEWQRDATTYWLQYPCHPPCELGRAYWGVWSEGMKLSLGEEGGKVCCFNIWVCFSLPESILIDNTLVNFPQVESVLPTMVIGKQLPCCYLNLLLYCFCFSSFIPCPTRLRGGWCKPAAVWEFGCYPSLTRHTPINRNDPRLPTSRDYKLFQKSWKR